jgi:hypothetical protein
MTYTEKAYISAGQALARATTERAAKARARIIDLMINTEQPADQARARQLVTEGEEEPPGLPALFFLSGCETDPSRQFFQNQPNQKPKCSHSKTTH